MPRSKEGQNYAEECAVEDQVSSNVSSKTSSASRHQPATATEERYEQRKKATEVKTSWQSGNVERKGTVQGRVQGQVQGNPGRNCLGPGNSFIKALRCSNTKFWDPYQKLCNPS